MSKLSAVIIGDSHAHPKFDNRRFEWAARFINERKPDIVVDIGDSADMSSIRAFDTRGPSVEFENQRYVHDIEAYHDAMRRFHRALKHKPRFVKLLGNHEQRIDRVVEASPTLQGHLSQADLHQDWPMWKVHALGVPVRLGSFLVAHYFRSPGGSLPISGVTPCRSVLQKRKCNALFGHTHRFEFYQDHIGSNGAITAINVGCFMEAPQIASQSREWAGDTTGTWNSGLLYLPDMGGRVGRAGFSFEWMGIKDVQARYA